MDCLVAKKKIGLHFGDNSSIFHLMQQQTMAVGECHMQTCMGDLSQVNVETLKSTHPLVYMYI